MTTMARTNLVTRRAVGKLEHRFGRKRLYWGGGLIVLVALLLTLRTIANRYTWMKSGRRQLTKPSKSRRK